VFQFLTVQHIEKDQMNYSMVFILLLAYSGFSFSFVLEPQVDVKDLKYPTKSFLQTIFEGSGRPHEIPQDLINLEYPKQSFLITLLTKSVTSFTRYLVSYD
jgi:hypothetical protein